MKVFQGLEPNFFSSNISTTSSFTFLSKKRFVFTFHTESWQVEDKILVSIKPKIIISIARHFSDGSFSTHTGHILSHLLCSYGFTWAFLPIFNVKRLCCWWYVANILALSVYILLPHTVNSRFHPLDFSFSLSGLLYNNSTRESNSWDNVFLTWEVSLHNAKQNVLQNIFEDNKNT
jgi:hypothetical protein